VDQRFVQGILYVPTLPTVLTRVLNLLEEENSSAGDLERIIQHDQALSSKVLSVANSAYYGFRQQIDTVRRAVVALGFDEIRSICLGAGLLGFLQQNAFRDPDFAGELWLHSLAVAEATRIIAVRTNSDEVDRAFTAGLLHDLGKVVLAAFFPDDLEALLSLQEQEAIAYHDAEIALGMEHWEIGKVLAGHWELPLVLEEAIGFHHNPSPSQTYFQLTAAVHLANELAHQLGIGQAGDDQHLGACAPEALAILEGGKADLDSIRDELQARREGIESLWRTLVSKG